MFMQMKLLFSYRKTLMEKIRIFLEISQPTALQTLHCCHLSPGRTNLPKWRAVKERL